MKNELKISAIAGFLLGILRSSWMLFLGRYDTAAVIEVILIATIVFAVFSRSKSNFNVWTLVVFLLICTVVKIVNIIIMASINISILTDGEFATTALFALETELYLIGLIAGGIVTLLKKMIYRTGDG